VPKIIFDEKIQGSNNLGAGLNTGIILGKFQNQEGSGEENRVIPDEYGIFDNYDNGS